MIGKCIPTPLWKLVFLAIPIASCAPSDEYDTPPPYRPAQEAFQPDGNEADPIYGTPPAYGDGATPEAITDPGGLAPGLPEDPGAAGFAPQAPAITSPAVPDSPGQPAVVHTVVSGDTLSGISRRYGVSMDAIRRANNMTNDIVVLGRKLIIPSR